MRLTYFLILFALVLFGSSCQKHPIEDEIALAQALATSLEESTSSADDDSAEDDSTSSDSDDDSSSDSSSSDDDSSTDSDSSDDSSDNDSSYDDSTSSDSDDDSSSDENDLSATVQGKINDYIAANYPGSSIVDIDLDTNDIDVKLNSGVELIFDLNGNFLRIDN